VKEKYYSPEEVAEIMNIRPETVRELCRKDKLKAIKIGRKWRIPESSITQT